MFNFKYIFIYLEPQLELTSRGENFNYAPPPLHSVTDLCLTKHFSNSPFRKFVHISIEAKQARLFQAGHLGTKSKNQEEKIFTLSSFYKIPTSH